MNGILMGSSMHIDFLCPVNSPIEGRCQRLHLTYTACFHYFVILYLLISTLLFNQQCTVCIWSVEWSNRTPAFSIAFGLSVSLSVVHKTDKLEGLIKLYRTCVDKEF
jgi:hypothetical protein